MEMEITVHSTNQQACVPVSVKETRAACSVISVVCSIISFHGNQAVVHLGQMTQLQSVKVSKLRQRTGVFTYRPQAPPRPRTTTKTEVLKNDSV